MSGGWCRQVERRTRIIGPDTLVFAGEEGTSLGEGPEPAAAAAAAASVIEFRSLQSEFESEL